MSSSASRRRSKPGGPDVLVPENRPVPTPKPGEVLIRIVAAGVNQADCHQRAGLWVAVASALSLPAAIWPTTVEAGENVARARPVMTE